MRGGRLLRITRWSEDVLHQPTQPVTEFDAAFHELLRDMFATMRAAEGVGLASTQVGDQRSFFVFRCPDADQRVVAGVVCNPVVELPSGRDRHLVSDDEGCLSLPGAFAPLARPDHAVCRGLDHLGRPIEIEGTGLLARCLQHETDHLAGTVFGDRLSGRARKKLYADHEQHSYRYPADWPVMPKGEFDPALEA
ncbi:MAG: peptide deformylase [Propionibacteriaceae bacterium]|nr:peptide deformylase [Propionibacteriaceae bacterium]